MARTSKTRSASGIVLLFPVAAQARAQRRYLEQARASFEDALAAIRAEYGVQHGEDVPLLRADPEQELVILTDWLDALRDRGPADC